ncbi:MAG: EAL domain-containing response regulator [Rhodospirillaceae bacterium]|nr:EAL domain-containing response regulator [Rhodospirillaceae bacterium]MCA8932722.1 EAL domain-containing response regulator [Rhodospirillaceae bacterium]
MSGPRVLVIDDEAEIGELVVSAAQLCGYNGEAVTNAQDFRAKLADFKPGLLVLDLQLPDIDGVMLLRELAERGSKAKIIIMSGFDSKVVESARQLGIGRGLDIVAMVQKPIRIKELCELLKGMTVEEEVVIDGAAIANGIATNAFWLAFQPKVGLANALNGADMDRPVGFEALLRWQHPNRGFVPPTEFIPVAETSGQMARLTEHVIDMALGQVHAWEQENLFPTVAINVSASDLHATDFADGLVDRCRDYRVKPERLMIELTETATMSDPVLAMDILTRLRIKGFRLSIDDFGTGYSSLVQLQRMPFSELKIDRAFVADCHMSPQARMIIKTMVDLAHNLGLSAIAEGVENNEILETVRELGCDEVQGFGIAKPMPAAEAGAWFRREIEAHEPKVAAAT